MSSVKRNLLQSVRYDRYPTTRAMGSPPAERPRVSIVIQPPKEKEDDGRE